MMPPLCRGNTQTGSRSPKFWALTSSRSPEISQTGISTGRQNLGASACKAGLLQQCYDLSQATVTCFAVLSKHQVGVVKRCRAANVGSFLAVVGHVEGDPTLGVEGARKFRDPTPALTSSLSQPARSTMFNLCAIAHWRTMKGLRVYPGRLEHSAWRLLKNSEFCSCFTPSADRQFITTDACPRHRAAKPGSVSQKQEVTSREARAIEKTIEVSVCCEKNNTEIWLSWIKFSPTRLYWEGAVSNWEKTHWTVPRGGVTICFLNVGKRPGWASIRLPAPLRSSHCGRTCLWDS